MSLKTDHKNFVWSGDKKYRFEQIDSGTYKIIDVTPYDQEGDSLGAVELNDICRQINQNTDNIGEINPVFDSSSITIGDLLIQHGLVSVTPNLGSSPNYYNTVEVAFPQPYSSTPFVITGGGSGNADLKNTAPFSISATGFKAFLSSSGQATRNVRWLAIGKR